MHPHPSTSIFGHPIVKFNENYCSYTQIQSYLCKDCIHIPLAEQPIMTTNNIFGAAGNHENLNHRI